MQLKFKMFHLLCLVPRKRCQCELKDWVALKQHVTNSINFSWRQHFTIIKSDYYCDNRRNNTTTFLSTHPVHRLCKLNDPINTHNRTLVKWLTVILKFVLVIAIILLLGAEQTHFTTHFTQLWGIKNSPMMVIKVAYVGEFTKRRRRVWT